MLADIFRKHSCTMKKSTPVAFSARGRRRCCGENGMRYHQNTRRRAACQAFCAVRRKTLAETYAACSSGSVVRKRGAAAAGRHGACCGERGKAKKDLAYARSFFLAPPAGFEPVACRLGVAPIRHREVTSNAKKCLEIQGFSAFQILSDTTL